MRPDGVGVLRLDISGEITRELADTVSRYVAAHRDYSIEITVDSEGGDWSASLSIFECLRHHGRRVSAIIEKAASGAALIVMSADYRQMSPSGHFFVHRPNGAYGKATLDEIADAKASLMAGPCRVPAARIRRWMDATTIITAERALAYGLVDEVPGLPKPKHPVVFL
jgi:ATP-dependent protease ClpP protease subunit